MIQDIAPKKFNNSFKLDATPKADSLVIIHKNGEFLLKLDESAGTINYPTTADLKCSDDMTYLFSVDDEDFFFPNFEIDSYPDGFGFYNMRKLRNGPLFPKHYVFAAFTAIQLMEWYEGTKYCGK